MRAAILVFAAGLLVGCAATRGAPAGGRAARSVRLVVPFFPDDTDQCGPSVLASVLGFWGKPASPAVLREEIYRAKLKGSLTVDLLLAAQSRGLSAELPEGGLERLKMELDAGRPVIVFVNAGFRFYRIGHYMVVTGYDDERRVVYAHSGLKRDRAISYAKLERQWGMTRNWTLLIRPHDADTWLAQGNADFQGGRYDAAEACYRNALAVSPRHPGACNNLAMTIIARGGDLSEALALARGALEREAAGPGSLRPYILDTLANIQLRQSRYAEALDLVGQAEEATPAGDRAVLEQLKATRDLIQSAAKVRDHAPGQALRTP